MDAMQDDFAALFMRDTGLPGRYFGDESIFQAERQKVFEDSWMCIGLSTDLREKSALLPLTVLGHPLLMVRDDRTLRVFHNVCSHRGSLLVESPGQARPRIVCPYHGWAYNLGGDLVATPHAVGFAPPQCSPLVRERLGLREVRAAEWAGHIFVNLSGAAPTFLEWIRPVAERFDQIDWMALRHDKEFSREISVVANWKIIVENFVESYHLPAVHPALNAANPLERHYQILGGHSYIGQGAVGYRAEEISGATLPRIESLATSNRYESLAIVPNLLLAPTADITFSIIILPESAQRTRERVEFFFVGDSALQEEFRPARKKSAEFITAVNTEDLRIVELVHRGRGSRAFGGGQFVMSQEATSLQFQKIVAARMLSNESASPEDLATLPTCDIGRVAAV
jgi:choline monooxygenase